MLPGQGEIYTWHAAVSSSALCLQPTPARAGRGLSPSSCILYCREGPRAPSRALTKSETEPMSAVIAKGSMPESTCARALEAEMATPHPVLMTLLYVPAKR
eukprot:2303379-Amphidinium_carterae.1